LAKAGFCDADWVGGEEIGPWHYRAAIRTNSGDIYAAPRLSVNSPRRRLYLAVAC